MTLSFMNERLEDIINHRKKKLQNFLDSGIDPYPSETARTHKNSEVVENFESMQDSQVILAGRIRSMRGMGKLIFAHIDDGTDRIQVLLKADDIGDEKFSFFLDNYDIGDFIEATGKLFITKTGEKTLQANEYKMLAKSLRPLPSEHFGIEDVELKLRKRYLDILLDSEVKE